MKTIFVIGSINADLLINAPYIPAKGETLTGHGFFIAQGGKGANQAVAAARSGGHVIMCGCVGKDVFGETAIKSLHAENIDTSHIRMVENVPTGAAMITIVEGDNRIILDRGANACLSKEDIDGTLSLAKKGDILLVQLENPIETVGYALRAAKEKEMYCVLNPAPAYRGIDEFLPLCDLVVPNETETEIFGGKENLRKMLAGDLIITMGSKGFEYCSGDSELSFPCMKVQAVDTTAAGDTFCGGMVARLSDGDDLITAAKYGSLAASIACTRKGAQPSIPRFSEIADYLK